MSANTVDLEFLEQLLADTKKKFPGILAVQILTITGYPIISVGADEEREPLISAMGAALQSISQRTANELYGESPLEFIFLQSKKGNLFIRGSQVKNEEFVYIFLSEKELTLGFAWIAIQSMSRQINEHIINKMESPD